jgi:putative oxidoreductase
MKKFLFDCGFRDATASLGILALRLMIGLMMLIGHGIPKIQGFAAAAKDFYVPDFFPLKYMSPTVSLIASISAEAGASTLIILGLATRPAAFVLGFNMVVAAFGVHAGAAWFMGQGVPVSKEPALLYLIPMIALILSGAGGFSMDALVYKEGKRRRW